MCSNSVPLSLWLIHSDCPCPQMSYRLTCGVSHKSTEKNRKLKTSVSTEWKWEKSKKKDVEIKECRKKDRVNGTGK